jgi:hypothetical protein
MVVHVYFSDYKPMKAQTTISIVRYLPFGMYGNSLTAEPNLYQPTITIELKVWDFIRMM